MEQKTIQEAPGTFGEAWRYGRKVGQELNAGRAKMRDIIAQRLKDCRLEKKITQQALALELSMNHLTYRGYENCKSDIPIVNLVKLADYFGVSMDYLTGRTDDKGGSMSGKTQDDTNNRIDQLEKTVAHLMSALENK